MLYLLLRDPVWNKNNNNFIRCTGIWWILRWCDCGYSCRSNVGYSNFDNIIYDKNLAPHVVPAFLQCRRHISHIKVNKLYLRLYVMLVTLGKTKTEILVLVSLVIKFVDYVNSLRWTDKVVWFINGFDTDYNYVKTLIISFIYDFERDNRLYFSRKHQHFHVNPK